jgi:hypothetical protein
MCSSAPPRTPTSSGATPAPNTPAVCWRVLAEFYAGAGLTRGLTVDAATDPATLDYVQAVEATVRFYGENEDQVRGAAA